MSVPGLIVSPYTQLHINETFNEAVFGDHQDISLYQMGLNS